MSKIRPLLITIVLITVITALTWAPAESRRRTRQNSPAAKQAQSAGTVSDARKTAQNNGAEKKNSIDFSVIKAHILSSESVKIATGSGAPLTCTAGNEGGRALKVPSGTIISIKEGKLLIGDRAADEEELLLRPEKDQDCICVNGRPYRGFMVVKKRKPSSFIVVNHVNIEDYLAGVLGGEVSASWPKEALKAQAVAARSYILSKKRTPRDADFDVYSTVMDQMYVGQASESPRLSDAVKETRGEVLTYNGDIVRAYYHSTCGGHTEDGAEVFPGDASFLKGSPCPHCKNSPVYSWEKQITTEDLKKALSKNNTCAGDIVDIKVNRWGASGRAADIVIVTSEGEKSIKGSELRMLIGPGQLKSTKFRMKILAEKKEMLPGSIQTRWIETPRHIQFVNRSLYAEMLACTTFGPFSPELDVPAPSPCAVKAEECIPVQEQSAFLSLFRGLDREKLTATIVFTGEGWGHGVGMCQWGAYTMASQGSTYRQILQLYYPGTVISAAVKEK